VFAEHQSDRSPGSEVDREHDHEHHAEQHGHGEEEAADDERQHPPPPRRTGLLVDPRSSDSVEVVLDGMDVESLARWPCADDDLLVV
jgi:hypothetical protein